VLAGGAGRDLKRHGKDSTGISFPEVIGLPSYLIVMSAPPVKPLPLMGILLQQPR